MAASALAADSGRQEGRRRELQQRLDSRLALKPDRLG